MTFNKIFGVTNEERNKIHDFYERSDKELETSVKSFRKWIESQPHIPQNQDDYFLEMMLKLNKFDEEKTRRKIDLYYSMRHIVPEFYENRSFFNEDLKTFMDAFMIVPLPRLTSNLERVYLVRFLDTDPNKFDLITNSKLLMSIFDIRLKYDAAIGEHYIYDLNGLRFGHVFKVNPLIVKKIYTVMEKAYSDKIKGIHFLNMPLIGNALINIAKIVLSEKLSNRVHSHKNLESLNEMIPAELLPVDYNGLQESSEELYKNWRHALESSDSWLEERARQKTNEDLRTDINKNNDSYFRNIFKLFGK